MSELREVERADVYKAGQLAASLTRSDDGVVFAYRPDWSGEAVASSLPVGRAPVVRPGGALPSFFTGLLPEGRRLGALRRELKTSADDGLTLLLGVGMDAVGDVQVVPEGVVPADVPARVELRGSVSDVSFEDLLAELGIRAERTALPGVQDKVSAAMLTLPVARQGTRYLLKLTPPRSSRTWWRRARAAGSRRPGPPRHRPLRLPGRIAATVDTTAVLEELREDRP